MRSQKSSPQSLWSLVLPIANAQTTARPCPDQVVERVSPSAVSILVGKVTASCRRRFRSDHSKRWRDSYCEPCCEGDAGMQVRLKNGEIYDQSS